MRDCPRGGVVPVPDHPDAGAAGGGSPGHPRGTGPPHPSADPVAGPWNRHGCVCDLLTRIFLLSPPPSRREAGMGLTTQPPFPRPSPPPGAFPKAQTLNLRVTRRRLILHSFLRDMLSPGFPGHWPLVGVRGCRIWDIMPPHPGIRMLCTEG